MSDRIPGSSWSNPITYRGWLIHLNDYVGPGDHLCAFVFSHEDYDGPEDGRSGWGATVEECKAEIDLIEDDAQAEAEEADDRARMVNVGGHRDGGSAA